jgi:ATP synthase protein I
MHGGDVEAALARDTVLRAVFVGPVLVGLFALLRGTRGAVGAAIGVTVVVVNFLVLGQILSRAARVSPGFYHAAALFGFLLRLGAITVTMLLVAASFDIDRMAFGISAVAAYLALLTLEAVAVTRREEYEWTS